MNRFLLVAVLMALGATSSPLFAQHIDNVCRANSYTCGILPMNRQLGVDSFWASIYGTGLPTVSQTYVRLTYSVSTPAVVTDYSEISSSSPYQTYWFNNGSQINFYPYPQNLTTGVPPGNSLSGNGSVTVCAQIGFVLVCSTNTFPVIWSN